MNINECYKKLNLSVDSSLEDVKKSYRKLAKIYHPDINPEGNEIFTSINEAYNFILEYKKNTNKNTNTNTNTNTNNSKTNYSKTNYNTNYRTSYNSNNYTGTYTGDSLWDEIFNKKDYNNYYNTQTKGSNIYIDYFLTPEDKKNINNKDFINKEIHYKKISICMSCQGTGKQIKVCPICNGSGINKSSKNKVITNCNNCNGLGTVEGPSLCPKCLGKGFIEKNSSVRVRIPLNIKNEFLITIPGKGNDDALKNNLTNNINYLYIPGDLIIKIIPLNNKEDFNEKNKNKNKNNICHLGTIRLSLYDLIKGKTYIFNRKNNSSIRLFIKPKTKLGLKKIKDKDGNFYSFNLEINDINYNLLDENIINIIKNLSEKNIL